MEKSCEKRGSNFCYPRDENHGSYSGKSMIDRDKQFWPNIRQDLS